MILKKIGAQYNVGKKQVPKRGATESEEVKKYNEKANYKVSRGFSKRDSVNDNTVKKNLDYGKLVKNRDHLVKFVFQSVAQRYDLMNDLMSFGLHRLWKRRLLRNIQKKSEKILLDVAGGTGDIARGFIDGGGKSAIVCDINEEMLKAGYQKFIDKNLVHLPVEWVQGNAESLPFQDASFDVCTISFGIRNVSDIERALREMYRILVPGGEFLCMEFINTDQIDRGVMNPVVRKIYNYYSAKFIPNLGRCIVGDAKPYQYLVDSIRAFPKHQSFLAMLHKVGFVSVKDLKMNFGTVGMYICKK